MRYPRSCLAILTAGLMASSCVINSYGWSVPTTVAAGSLFVIEITGSVSVLYQSPIPVTAVVQVPNGFEVLGSWATATAGIAIVTRDDPAVLTQYTVEPGHFLTSLGGIGGANQSIVSCSAKLMLRAPLTVGAHEFKLSVMVPGPPALQRLPGGLTDFSLIPGSNLQVVNGPNPSPFAVRSLGPVLATWNNRRMQTCDFDNDGRDDLFVFGSADQVLLSRPGGWVSGTGNLPGTTDPVAVGDFDGDGFGDVVHADGAVFFGSGTALWTPGPTLPHGLAFSTISVATGDVDGDGRADVVFADPDGYAVFRSNANRTFTAFGGGLPSTASTLLAPMLLQVRDVDGDGLAEIVSIVDGGLHRLWRSDGQGNWSFVGNLPPLATDVALLDFDGDGALDLVFNHSTQRYTLTAQGLVAAPQPLFDVNHLVAIDQDGDGRCDLVLAKNAIAGSGLQSTIELRRNLGAGVFAAVPLPAQDGFHVLLSTHELTTGDLDGDGFQDLLANFASEPLMAWRSTATAALPYGDACSAPGFAAPALTAIGVVAPQQTIALQVDGALPNGFALLWAGSSKHDWFGAPVLPLSLDPIGASGCALLAEPLVVIGITANAAGVATVPVTLPSVALPPSSSVFTQAAVFVPGANALGFLFTNGLAIKLQ